MPSTDIAWRCQIQVVADTSEREVDAYKEVQDKLKEQMVQTEGEIEKLKDRVAHERVVRKNKEEYATLAKQVETLAPRKQTEKDRAVLQEQINRLEEQTQTQYSSLLFSSTSSPVNYSLLHINCKATLNSNLVSRRIADIKRWRCARNR
eukprot:2487312-Rhodomonas_salina.2